MKLRNRLTPFRSVETGDPVLLDAALVFLVMAIIWVLYTILEEIQKDSGLPGDPKDKKVRVKKDDK